MTNSGTTEQQTSGAEVVELPRGVIYTGDAVLDLSPFPRGSLSIGEELTVATDVMRAVSTHIAGATYELERPIYHLTRKHDEHGCQRLIIDISDGAVHV